MLEDKFRNVEYVGDAKKFVYLEDDYVVITYNGGESFFCEFKEPRALSLNLNNVVLARRMTYPVVRKQYVEVPNGWFRRLFRMAPAKKLTLVKIKDISVIVVKTIDDTCLYLKDDPALNIV